MILVTLLKLSEEFVNCCSRLSSCFLLFSCANVLLQHCGNSRKLHLTVVPQQAFQHLPPSETTNCHFDIPVCVFAWLTRSFKGALCYNSSGIYIYESVFCFFLLAVFYLPIEECGSCVSSLKVLDCGILCKGLRSDFLQQSKGCDVMLVPIDSTWAHIQILYFLPAQWETASNSSLYLER